jgi:hypothetical protein
VWFPKYVASEITSLNQNDIHDISKIKAIEKKVPEETKLCIIKTPEVVKAKREPLVNIGQGEGDTR